MTHRGKDAPPEVVATIGVFDGVHLGHQALIRRVVERAALLGVPSACVTFSPHPEDVLRPDSDIAHLASLQDRLAIIEGLGISRVVVLEFTHDLSQLSPEEFLGLLEQRFRLRELWIGSDFALGRGRSGTPERLAAIGLEKGFAVCPFPPVELRGQVVSSSRLRRLLVAGEVEEAALLLGRSYRLRGLVISGDGRGRTIGFATANLAPDERMCVPGDGVYAVRARVEEEGEDRPGVANVGVRPTFGESGRQIEIHLLDFGGELYGKRLAVDFAARLRGEQRFETVDALKAQIAEDVRRARAVLG
ncbi:MAG: bifunctional riboflavin kinase/FAD synthetase [Chloroflexota bacterium]